MEYFEDAVIRFKCKKDCDIDKVHEVIKKELRKKDLYKESSYAITCKPNNIVEIELFYDFEFYAVEDIVKAAIKAGLKKFGRDKLIAYQTTACVYFKNYVTKDGEFLDFCGDCAFA